MIKNVIPGIYYPAESFLHRLQALTKLLLFIWLVVFLTIAVNRRWHLVPYAATALLLVAGIAFSGASPRLLWRRLRVLLWIALIGFIITLLFVGAGGTDTRVLYTLGPLVITDLGVWISLQFFTILFALYGFSLLLTMTTTPVALVEGMMRLLAPLRRLRLPVDDFALMCLIALRFIPTLMDEVEMLAKAQLARGADFTHGRLRDRLLSVTTLIIPLIQTTLRRSAELATALEARGYEFDERRTLLHEQSLAPRDYLTLGLVLLLTVLALIP